MEHTQGFEELFPNELKKRVIDEFMTWVSLEDISIALTKVIAVPSSKSRSTGRIILTFDDCSRLEACLIELMSWMIKHFELPHPKLDLIKAMRPNIEETTLDALRNLTFKPNVSIGGPGQVSQFPEIPPKHVNDRFLLIEDDPVMIDMVYRPLRCLVDITSHCSRQVAENYQVTSEYGNESGPEIYHTPHADSVLGGSIDALCYYSCGMKFGPMKAIPESKQVNNSYRSLSVQSLPPFDKEFMDTARTIAKGLL